MKTIGKCSFWKVCSATLPPRFLQGCDFWVLAGGLCAAVVFADFGVELPGCWLAMEKMLPRQCPQCLGKRWGKGPCVSPFFLFCDFSFSCNHHLFPIRWEEGYRKSQSQEYYLCRAISPSRRLLEIFPAWIFAQKCQSRQDSCRSEASANFPFVVTLTIGLI